MQPKVSVIIPVYQVEPYLDRCMQSVLCQTLKDIEIILVDDGSPDNCGQMCDEYAVKDTRVKVIHKPNEGLGMARNSGMEIATGEYVAFVDSDDYIALEMYEKLYFAAKAVNADTCLCSFNRVDCRHSVHPFGLLMKKRIYKRFEVLSEVLVNVLGTEHSFPKDINIGVSVCKALYTLDIIRKNEIRFCSEKKLLYEDMIFATDYFPHANSVAILPEPLYYYCENEKSLSMKYKPERFNLLKVLYYEMIKRLENIGVWREAGLRLNRTFIAHIRLCIMQEAYNAANFGRKKSIENIGAICADEMTQKILCNYPVSKLPVKLCVYTWLMKIKSAYLLYLLAKLNG